MSALLNLHAAAYPTSCRTFHKAVMAFLHTCTSIFSPSQVINEDYNDFVSLSTKLVNVDAALNRMQRPLVELQVSHSFACFAVRLCVQSVCRVLAPGDRCRQT